MRCGVASSFVLLLCAAPHAEAGWLHDRRDASGGLPATSLLGYDAAIDVGVPQFSTALDALAETEGTAKLDLVALHARVLEADFQQELFSLLRASAPRELEAALSSSGNHDNPAMLALRKSFRQAVLDSTVVARLGESLATHGLHVSTVQMEKLVLDTKDGMPQLRCLLWLTIQRR